MPGAVFLLPKSHPDPTTWATLIAKWKALRLHSLLISPSSFSSTYERESAFTASDWEARLRNPSAYSYVATSTPSEPSHKHISTHGDDVKAFLDSDWVGSAVLYGPADEDAAMFDVYGLFVLPDARGAGLGKALMDACTAHARDMAAAMNVGKVVVRVSVTHGNERVLKLYERAGFVENRAKAEAGMPPDVTTLVKEVGV